MADIAFPTDIILPSKFVFGLVSNTRVFTSPITGAARSMALPGYRWVARMEWDVLSPAESAKVEAFLTRLRGQENRLLLHNLSRPTPRGTAAGSPVVNGGGQTGSTLVTSGWTASQANLLLPGDMIGVNGMLLMITQQISSNASGQATLVFEPPMWNVPPNGASIVTNKPTGRFIATSNRVDWMAGLEAGIGAHSLEVVETLNA